MTFTDLVLLVVLTAAAVAALAYGIRFRTRAREAGGTDTPGPALTAEELAYLIGGPVRLGETVIAALVAADRVRVGREGRLSAVTPSGSPPTVSRLEAAALAAIGSGNHPGAVIVAGIARSPAVTDIRDRLGARDLLLPPATRRACRLRALTPLAAVGVAAGVAALSAGGVAWVGFAFLCAVTFVAALQVWLAPLPARTLDGDAVVAGARQFKATQGISGTTADLLHPPILLGAAGLVAVGGLAAFPDPVLAEAMALAQVKAHAAASSGWNGCGGGYPDASTYSDGGTSGHSSHHTCQTGSCGGSSGGSSCGGGGCGGGGGGCGGGS